MALPLDYYVRLWQCYSPVVACGSPEACHGIPMGFNWCSGMRRALMALPWALGTVYALPSDFHGAWSLMCTPMALR